MTSENTDERRNWLLAKASYGARKADREDARRVLAEYDSRAIEAGRLTAELAALRRDHADLEAELVEVRSQLDQRPTPRQWGAWLATCAVMADDVSAAERHGLRLAATHMLSDKGPGWAAECEVDDEAFAQLRAEVWDAVERGRATHGPGTEG